MAGKIKSMIDAIIAKRTQGNPALINTTKAKFVLKGINPDAYTASSADDTVIIGKLQALAADLGIAL